jgi:hypothetical protein
VSEYSRLKTVEPKPGGNGNGYGRQQQAEVGFDFAGEKIFPAPLRAHFSLQGIDGYGKEEPPN